MKARSWMPALFGAVCLVLFCHVSAWSQSFTLSAAPGSITIHPGDQNIPLTVTASSSTYTGPINVTLTGLPSGITVSPLTLTAGGSGTLQISASVSAAQEDFSPNVFVSANGPAHTVTVIGAVGSVSATTTFTLDVSISNPNYAPDSNSMNLPIVRIDTSGVAIADKTTDVPGTITISSADGQTSYLPNSGDSDNTATFHLHGNTTALMLKKPYHVKLNTSLDLLGAMGLSCPYVTGSGKAICDKSKSYILLANFDDKTFLRDWAASALANAIPLGNGYLNSPTGSPSPSGTSALMPWAPHSLFVELYLNGQYEGNYQLIEEVKVDSHRVNITELAETDTTDDVTGGYLLEIDQEKGEAFNFVTPEKVDIGIIDPDFSPDPEVPQQTSYINNYVDTAESALFSSTYTDPTLGWRAYFDEASAVNFYIVNELMGNEDGGRFYSSDYLYKAKDNPLLYMGPIWDFDISAGNVNYSSIVNPTTVWMQQQATWYRQLFTDPAFKADVATQWNSLRSNGVITAWLASINQQAATLEQSQANNFGRWPMQGIEVWPNPEAVGSYDGEVSYMVNWLTLRAAWLDSQLNSKAMTTTALTLPAGTLRNGTAATLTAQVKGTTTPTGTVSFLSSGVMLGNGTLDGTGTATLTTSNLPVGTENLQAIYSGDTTNALSGSAPQSSTVLSPLLSTVTSLAASGNTSFTVSVIGNSGATAPTGSLTFTANGTTLGTATLAGGTAAFSPAGLPGGNVSVQAVYSGDSTYAGSSSNTVSIDVTLPQAATPVLSPAAGTYTSVQTVTITDTTPGVAIYYTTDGTTPTTLSTPYTGAITVSSTEAIEAIATAAGYAYSSVASAAYTINLPPPTFTLAISPSSASIRSTQSATFTLTVTPQNDFTQQIGFACSGLPSGEACSFSPATVTPGNAAATSTLTISGSATSANASPHPLSLWTKMTGGIVLALLIWPFRRRRSLYLWVLLLGTGALLWGCGSSESSTAKTTTSSITVTASGGSVSQSQTVTLAITQ